MYAGSIKKLSAEEIEQQMEKQLEFLRLVHPFLNEEDYSEVCMEIRPIRRTSGYPLKSLNLWQINEKALHFYEKFLNRINGQAVCLYYSVFAFNSQKACYKADGTMYQKGKINNQNAEFTQVLVMDFDGISEKEYKHYKHIFKDLNIETISIFSGHGYQDIILLSERIYDKKILEQFTGLLLQKGFPVDSSIKDPARVMRMPYSFNAKAFDEKNKHHHEKPELIPTKILSWTEKRYHLEEVFQQLMSLSDKNTGEPIKDSFEEKTSPSTIKTNSSDNLVENDLEEMNRLLLNELYPLLEGEDIPLPIQRMLYQTREGFRNKVLMFLIPYLRNHLALKVDEIKEIISIWAGQCEPKLDIPFARMEAERILNYQYTGKLGAYDDDMKKEFGRLDFGELDVYERNRNRVVIPNQVFRLYDTLSEGAVKIYFAMKAQAYLSPKKAWEQEDIEKFAAVSKATFYRNIKELMKFSLVEKIKGSKKEGTKTTYRLIDPEHLPHGYTLFDAGTIENMIHHEYKSLTTGELKLYTYLSYITRNLTETWMSQERIGKEINMPRTTVCYLTGKLEEKQYIDKETYKGEDNKDHCRYRLNYTAQ